MAKFLIRRIVFMFLTMILVSIAIFFVAEIAPGNIARNTLGNFVTPEQEASFNAQNGLDQPALTRYLRWIFGSDRQAQRLVGRSITHTLNPKTKKLQWWAVDDDGTLYQSYTPDGETVIKVVRQPDGSVLKVDAGTDLWRPNEEGVLVYWGITKASQAAMWVHGEDLEQWTLNTTANWTTKPSAPRRYIKLSEGILRGDFGVSLLTHRPVSDGLFRRTINSFYLAGISFLIIMPISLLFGLIAGLNEGKLVDRVLSIGSLIAAATPSYAVGVFLILIFATWLDVLPGVVILTNDAAIFKNPLQLVLPIATLTLVDLGYVLRITRASMIEVMRTNYIRTAVINGLPRYRIVFKHALKNALLTPITVIMLHVNWLVGGLVLVEALFAFPGLGSYALRAAASKDVFALEAAAMIFVVLAVSSQLVADLIYTYLNPRISYD
jgi:peptide/nickel transport system permease protein